MQSFKEQLIREYRETKRINSTLDNIKISIKNHKDTPGLNQDEALWLIKNWDVLFYLTKNRNKNSRNFFVIVYQNQPDISLYDVKNEFEMSPGRSVDCKNFFLRLHLIKEVKTKNGQPNKKYLRINKKFEGICDILFQIISSEKRDSYLRNFNRRGE